MKSKLIAAFIVVATINNSVHAGLSDQQQLALQKIANTQLEQQKTVREQVARQRNLLGSLKNIDERQALVATLEAQPATHWKQRKHAFKEAVLLKLAAYQNPVSDYFLTRFLVKSRPLVDLFTQKHPHTIPVFARLAEKEQVKSSEALICSAALTRRENFLSNIGNIAVALRHVRPEVAQKITPITCALFTEDLAAKTESRRNYSSFNWLYTAHIEKDPTTANAFSKALLENPTAKLLTDPFHYFFLESHLNSEELLNAISKQNPESLAALTKAAADNKWDCQYRTDQKKWVSARATLQTELYMKFADKRTKNGVPC